MNKHLGLHNVIHICNSLPVPGMNALDHIIAGIDGSSLFGICFGFTNVDVHHFYLISQCLRFQAIIRIFLIFPIVLDVLIIFSKRISFK
jgi:hypothetical protein